MSFTNYRVVLDRWNVDWNIVAQLAPADYVEKYLVNRKHVPSGYISLDHELDDDEHAIADGIDDSLRNMQQHLDAIQTPMGGHTIEDEEELEILRQVNGVGAAPKRAVPCDPDNMTANNLQDTERQCSSRNNEKPNWDLREIHGFNNQAGVGDPGVPLLPIPKRYLAIGSVVHYGTDLQYSIVDTRSRDSNVVGLCKKRLMVNDEKIQIVKGVYYFDRVKNFTSDKKGALHFLTFSEKTKGIYWTFWDKATGDKRYKKQVRRLGMRCDGLKHLFSQLPGSLVRKFGAEVIRRANRDLGDIYFPNPDGLLDMDKVKNYNYGPYTQYLALALSGIVWQYKAQKPLHWVDNRVFLENLSHILSPETIQQMTNTVDPIDGAMSDADIRIKGHNRSRMLRRISKTCKESTSPKDILKAICGIYYKSIQYQVLSKYMGEELNNAFIGLIGLECAIQNGSVPKSAHHFLSEVLVNVNSDNFMHLQVLFASFFNFSGNSRRKPDSHIYGKFIAFNRKLFRAGTNPIDWHHFEDTMRMASDFGIRVRLNKYNDAYALTQLHDKLSDYARRDKRMLRSYPVFMPFAHPTKMYGKKGDFEFVHLTTAEALVDEAEQMKHCVSAYSSRCFKGESLIFALRNGRSWITIELDGSDPDYRVKHKYTIGDFTVESGEFQDMINEWHDDILAMHRQDKTTYQNLVDHVVSVIDNRQRIVHWQTTNDEDIPIDKVVGKCQDNIVRLTGEIEQLGFSSDEVLAYVQEVEQAVAHPKQQGQPRPAAYDPWDEDVV